ncbi:MAG: hypothetical protein ABIH72_04070 [archaeon]
MCNYKVIEIVLGLVVLVFALWETTYSKWLIVIAGVLLILHALICKECKVPAAAAPVKKVTRKKKR